MPQGNVTQDTTYTKPAANVGIKYRTTNSGNPLAHNDVDANFELLRQAINGIVSDIDGVVDKDVLTNVPSSAVFTDTQLTTAEVRSKFSAGSNITITNGVIAGSAPYTHPNHSGDVTSVGDGATTIATGAVTEAKIATGAVTGTKIADNSITTNQLVTTGNNSISLTQVVGKTLIIHIGNYYDRNGTQQLASDTFNYNSSNDTYGLRDNTAIPFTDSTHPGGWLSYHTDTSSAETIKPFATVIAGARYALHNFGMGCYVQFMIHGHVAWGGTYDFDSPTGYIIKDVRNWDMFGGVSFMGASPGTYSGSDSAYIGYSNAAVTGRIDVDCNARDGIPPGFWFRGPRCFWSGINFVFHKADHGDISPIITAGAGFHEIRGLRMASVQPTGGNNYFYPFRFAEQAKVFMSSGTDSPMEIHVAENCNIISAGDASSVVYSNNHNTNQIYINSSKSNPGIRLIGLYGNSECIYKNSPILVKSGISPDTTINTFGQLAGFCKIMTYVHHNPWYVPGSTANTVDTSSWYYIFTHELASPTTSKTNFTYTGDPTNGLKSKWSNHSGAYTSTLTALSPTRLTNNDSYKNSPTARQDNPYTDQK